MIIQPKNERTRVQYTAKFEFSKKQSARFAYEKKVCAIVAILSHSFNPAHVKDFAPMCIYYCMNL